MAHHLKLTHFRSQGSALQTTPLAVLWLSSCPIQPLSTLTRSPSVKLDLVPAALAPVLFCIPLDIPKWKAGQPTYLAVRACRHRHLPSLSSKLA